VSVLANAVVNKERNAAQDHADVLIANVAILTNARQLAGVYAHANAVEIKERNAAQSHADVLTASAAKQTNARQLENVSANANAANDYSSNKNFNPILLLCQSLLFT
jgi:hypothetical protein